MKDTTFERLVIGFALVLSLLILVGMSGCTPMTELEREEAEYKRVEYLETQFLPMVQACNRNGTAFLLYDGPYDRRLSAALQNGDYYNLHIRQMRAIRCTNNVRAY